MNIAIKNLSLAYRNEAILKDISCQFPDKKINLIVGDNGAGKSSLLYTIANFEDRHSGHISFNDQKPTNQLYQQIIFLGESQNDAILQSVRSYLKDIALLYGWKKQEARREIYKWLKFLHIEKYHKKYIAKLSKGSKQKVGFIAAFLNKNADLYLLDEPFEGVDIRSSKKILSMLKKLNKTVVIISHRVELFQNYYDTVFKMENGQFTKIRNLNSYIDESGGEENAS